MSETEWFCGVQLGGVKLPAEFPAARNYKSMVHAGTGRWRQKNGRPMLIVGSRLAVYRMAVVRPMNVQKINKTNVYPPHPGGSSVPGGLGVNISKVLEISRTAEKIDKQQKFYRTNNQNM